MSDPKPDVLEQVIIQYGPHKGTYNVHPVATLFPLLQGHAYKELMDSIRAIGQQDAVVLDGTILLDGRNRVAVANDLGIEPLVVQFADLHTGVNQGDWIAAKNLDRRHLTNDQYLAISARYFDWCKEESKRNDGLRTATSDKQDTAADVDAVGDNDLSTPDDFPPKPAENATPRKRGRPRGQRSDAETLARKTKQSRYRTERMLKIRAYSPELAAAVEEGRLELKEAVDQMQRETASPEQDNSGAKPQKTKRPPDDEKIERASVGVIDDARLVAKKLRKDEQPKFWHQIAWRAQDILRCQFAEDAEAIQLLQMRDPSPSSSEPEPE